MTDKQPEALRLAEVVAYLDAVDDSTVYVTPQRKGWLDERDDKEWRNFHYAHRYDTPLVRGKQK